MKIITVTVCLLLVGCGGASFEDSFSADPGDSTPIDGGGADVAPDGMAAGGSAELSAGGYTSSGGRTGAGGATAAGGANAGGSSAAGGAPETGGAPAVVPEPACCVDSDCPASIPFCSPWGTCYQGGDPYTCDYDVFCESFCVHCSGRAAGACDEKRCVCS